jgi:hypothetical protein
MAYIGEVPVFMAVEPWGKWLCGACQIGEGRRGERSRRQSG